jgi:hypothetical protein
VSKFFRRRDRNILTGAYTSLGALYKVPDWPIGFGSGKKAKDLDRAVAIAPESIDVNSSTAIS